MNEASPPTEAADRKSTSDAPQGTSRDGKIGLLLVNLGTPDGADAASVRRYLKEFLTDGRVIENQGPLWQLVLNGVINSSMEPARTTWERLSHGFQLSSMLQYYSALPFNITSGVTTVQGTAGRPVVNAAFIERNAGIGPDFFSLNARLSRTFKIGRRLQAEGVAEVFNLTNRVNVVTLNGNFGSGMYPTNRSSTFGQITAVGDPRAVQFALRLRF